MELGDLAEHIAAVEAGRSLREITAQERKNVSIGRFQLHLPKMHIAGAVAYNQSRGIIARGKNFDWITRYLPMERYSPTAERFQTDERNSPPRPTNNPPDRPISRRLEFKGRKENRGKQTTEYRFGLYPNIWRMCGEL